MLNFRQDRNFYQQNSILQALKMFACTFGAPPRHLPRGQSRPVAALITISWPEQCLTFQGRLVFVNKKQTIQEVIRGLRRCIELSVCCCCSCRILAFFKPNSRNLAFSDLFGFRISFWLKVIFWLNFGFFSQIRA